VFEGSQLHPSKTFTAIECRVCWPSPQAGHARVGLKCRPCIFSSFRLRISACGFKLNFRPLFAVRMTARTRRGWRRLRCTGRAAELVFELYDAPAGWVRALYQAFRLHSPPCDPWSVHALPPVHTAPPVTLSLTKSLRTACLRELTKWRCPTNISSYARVAPWLECFCTVGLAGSYLRWSVAWLTSCFDGALYHKC
jgi:hypothetical protein